MKTGIELIAEERQRQIDVEGWTAEHDDQYNKRELARAAASYAMYLSSGIEFIRTIWPWDWSWWKPSERKDDIRNLAKAGALIAAEIDRLQRAANPEN